MPNLKLRADIFRERGYAKSINGVHKVSTVTRYGTGWEFESKNDGQFYQLSISIPISQKEYEKEKVLNALQ